MTSVFSRRRLSSQVDFSFSGRLEISRLPSSMVMPHLEASTYSSLREARALPTRVSLAPPP